MAVRTTIYLSEDLDRRLRELVPPRGLNRFINEVVAERVAALEEARILAEMREGYAATREDRGEISQDWEVITAEGWPE
jgi:predicted transcriptional regulator